MKTTHKNKVKKKPWHWVSIHQIAFDNVKKTIAKELVLAYPDFTKPFEIYVNPQTVTNTLWKRDVPKCNFLFGPLPLSIQGLPIWKWGLCFLPSIELRIEAYHCCQKFRKKPIFPPPARLPNYCTLW